MNVEDRRPEVFTPDSRTMLRAIHPHIDDTMLREIAEADYGMKADSTEAVLRKMRDDPHHSGIGDCQTGEVIELIRWSQPDDPQWKPGRQGVDGHWMRSFCCVWFLREIGECGRNISNTSYNETIIQLLFIAVSDQSAS